VSALKTVFWLILLLALVQIIAGILIAGSIAAAADGFHSLFDVAGITIVIVVSAVASRGKPASKRLRLERQGATAVAFVLVLTAVFLVAVGGYRLAAGEEVESPWLMLILGSLGVTINSLALWILHKPRNQGKHLYSAYLHRAGDFFSSALVMIGAGAIIAAETLWGTDVHFLDSVMVFIIALFLIALAWRIIKWSYS
jgi:cobalt-zinc-cadmium efflux system protein